MRPAVSRKPTRRSPRSCTLRGGPSGSGNSLERRAGIQYRRIASPMGVPAAVLVTTSFSSRVNISARSSCWVLRSRDMRRLSSPVFRRNSATAMLRGRGAFRPCVVEAHRASIGDPDLLWLAGQEHEALREDRAGRAARFSKELAARRALEVAVAADDGEADAAVRLGVADHGLGLTARANDLDLLEHLPAHHDDSAIALAEMLLGSVGDRALSNPRDEILVHHVGRDEPAGRRIFDRRVPGGDAVLRERLHLVRYAVEEPPDAERVGVVDGDAPLEVRPGEQTVRPQTGAPDRPQLVRLRVALHHTPVDEPVVELLEAELEVRRSLRAVGAAQHAGPVPVQ